MKVLSLLGLVFSGGVVYLSKMLINEKKRSK
jgi:hypothetical protein